MTNLYKEIQDKASILQVIGSYIPLTRKGKGYVGLCPFHDDNHPSLHIDLTKQIYKCFSCGAGGNAVKFVKEYEGISFSNAAKKVIKICGLNIEIQTFETTKPKETVLHQILNKAATLYSYFLIQDNKNLGFNWLQKRGITTSMINQFNLGWSISNDDILTRYLLSKNFRKEDILKTNLTTINRQDKLVDFFRERVMYPLKDIYGSVIGFVGRCVNEVINQPKFLVLPNTSLFNKGDQLYNIHEIYKNQFTNIILVEGMHDVITLYGKGIRNVLGLLGTSLTKNHLFFLQKLNIESVLLLLDGDDPGKEATNKIKNILLDNGIIVKTLKENIVSDPDDFFRSKTIVEVKKFLNNYETYTPSHLKIPITSSQSWENNIDKNYQKTSNYHILGPEKYLLQSILNDPEKKKLLSFYLDYGGEMVSSVAKEIGDYLFFLYIINLHREENKQTVRKLSYYMLSYEAKQELDILLKSDYLKISDESFKDLVARIKDNLKRKIIKDRKKQKKDL